ncbi:F-box/FBD/LRR-repeat protein At1g13570-like [Solanum pennellii]|uniref:F-box/FBD/LRR-repeat protein At1g13570-like n=1 Tax=Solanum pennellii TaxID=28526 RepID=A0ABM1HLA8_SOLPN|nr:F-box/FBD/LRR-repeat protein At1g13570-like [Solanum pennellii]
MKRAELGNHVNERMFEFGERIGWTLQNVDEKLISDFCSKIGVKKKVLKVWLYNNNKTKKHSKYQPTAAVILPELVIHKILSNLNYVEASRMTILSKTWQRAWLTHPNLLFVVYSGTDEERRIGKIDADIVDKIMKRYMDEKIPIDKFELSMEIVTPTTGYLFSSIDKWLDIALQNGVRELVYRNLEYHSSFNIFKMLTAKCLREVVLRNCNLVYFSSLPSGHVGNCHSLRKLSLTSVTVDDNMLQGLLANYPLIENLIIRHCRGWKKCEVRNLQKIRSLCITIKSEQVVKIEAPTLEHLSYSSYVLGKLDIGEYPNLKSLELFGPCYSTRVNIGRSESLRDLKINNLLLCCCQKIEVDAPNLVSLEYEGSDIPQLELAKESSNFNKLTLNFNKNSFNVGWFYLLMEFLLNSEFLSNSTSWSQVSLHIYSCDGINMEYLKQYYRVAIPQVDVLDVIIESREDFPTFVDAFLWCFCPRRLNISSSFKTIIYLINQLLYLKNSSHGDKPQLSQLKAYKFDRKNGSWHPVKPRSMKLLTGDPNEMEKFYFLLNW